MNIQLQHLIVRTRKTTERIEFSEVVTFLHGPIGKGKSTVARLIDYCLGGDLERTPAIQQEFVAAELSILLGDYNCTIERAVNNAQTAKITWTRDTGESNCVHAPLKSQGIPLINADVYNLSDLIFYLCGVKPFKIHRGDRKTDSQSVNLNILDVWYYCHLEQTHLDSSFFHLEDKDVRKRVSQAMCFFTGLYSDKLIRLEDERSNLMLKKRHKSRTADEIRSFMSRFRLESESNVENQLQHTEQQLAKAEQRRTDLDQMRATQTHPTDVLRSRLRQLSTNIETIHQAIMDSVELIAEYNALRAELITAKTKSVRIDRAKGIFDSISCKSCPECGTDISNRPHIYEQCRLCGSRLIDNTTDTSQDLDVLHQEFTERIEQITDSINRREHKLSLMKRELTELQHEKKHLDKQLEEELARYDSVFIENIRASEREIATLVERLSSLRQHRKMSKEVTTLEEELDSLQRRIDVLKTSISKEQDRLHAADVNVLTIKEKFKQIMLSISFPEVSKDDNVIIDPETWNPKIVHGEQEWDFWVAGSGGKKTLFNVCYALALHSAALERDMPVPNVLIIDSPTKNISRDMNPEQVRSLYAEIYRLAKEQDGHRLQFLLIDSDLIEPSTALPGFLERRMAGEPDAPSLISYYIGP